MAIVAITTLDAVCLLPAGWARKVYTLTDVLRMPTGEP
jgi:hypothetical protein